MYMSLPAFVEITAPEELVLCQVEVFTAWVFDVVLVESLVLDGVLVDSWVLGSVLVEVLVVDWNVVDDVSVVVSEVCTVAAERYTKQVRNNWCLSHMRVG